MKNYFISIGRVQHIVPYKMLLIMKLTFVLMVTIILQASASSYAQKITLSERNVSLEQVFWSISNQSEYEFIYDAEMLKKAKRVDVELKNKTLEEAMEQCFAGQSLTYKISDNTVIVTKKVDSFSPIVGLDAKEVIIENQSLTIRGQVTDSDGEALSGVSIQQKGTTVGTTTDGDGRYTINVSDNNSVLVFSYIGYITLEVNVNNRNLINVILEVDNESLSEVVVTALGIERESKSLTYSAQTISADKINEAKETNLINSRQGKVAGVTITRNATRPGSSSKVLLRGSRSIYGNNQPLYVIDGVPLDNSSRSQGGGSRGDVMEGMVLGC